MVEANGDEIRRGGGSTAGGRFSEGLAAPLIVTLSLGNQALRTSIWMDHILGEKPAMVAGVAPLPFKIIA